MQALYRQTGWNFSPHLYDITAEFTPDEEHGRILATLATGPDAAIHYTLDGSRPDRSSPRYTGPLPVDCDASLRAVAFTADSVASDLLRKEIRFNRATLRRVELQTHPAPKYAENRLTDGVRGSTIYARGGWTGFHDDDLDAVVDLGRATDVSRAGISTLIDYGSHIMDATWMEVSVSDDGTSFATVARQSYPEQPFSLRKELPVHELRFEPVRTRFVRIRAGRARQLPAQMTVPPGSRPFLFVDEIFVR